MDQVNQSFLNFKLLKEFVTLISQKIGLQIRPQNQDYLEHHIISRTQALKLNSSQDYYQVLRVQTKESQKEWEKLISILTNNESYFFRDKGQFKLLRERILPELIERKKQSKQLRICSAGCSTGQEPYSLAILLKELIPNLEQWKLLILGIDLSQEALDIAKIGCYNDWSFRQVNQAIQQRYFDKIGEKYQLKNDIREMLTFQQCNLVKNQSGLTIYNFSEMHNFDLIICRNVFIYFHYSAIDQILDQFYQFLEPLGYLLTGHAEVSHHKNLKQFQVKLFPESIIYQKPQPNYNINNPTFLASPINTSIVKEKVNNFNLNTPLNKNKHSTNLYQLLNDHQLPENLIANITNNSDTTDIKDNQETEFIAEIQVLLDQKSYQVAIRKLTGILEQFPQSFQGNYLMAETYANLGKYQEAISYCHRALAINSVVITPHHLLVQIAEEQGEFEEAKKLLRKIIYLEPYSIFAHLSLSNIYQKTKDFKRANKMKENVLNILKDLPPDTPIIDLNNITVKDLIAEIKQSQL